MSPRLTSSRAGRLTAALAAVAVTAAAGATAASAASPTPQLPATTVPIAPITVLSGGHAHGAGDIFLTPTDAAGTYAQGAEIASSTGQPLWFHQAPAGDVDADLRAQTLNGRPVLTFWEGTNFGGLSPTAPTTSTTITTT